MATWDDGLAALRSVAGDLQVEPRKWRSGIRMPIVVMGAAGAGKTELWRQITGESARDAMSRRNDQAYVFGRRGNGKRSISLTTIPGQFSKPRRRDLAVRFGDKTMLKGVVFVASYGFDYIWPKNADGVAADLDPFTIDTLSERNLKYELRSFGETCRLIREKFEDAPELTPEWLLVLVNKADLYWNAFTEAANRYRPGCGSGFDEIAQETQAYLGAGHALQYEVLPTTFKASDYVFHSSRGNITSPTSLTSGHAAASLRFVMSRLEDLCEL